MWARNAVMSRFLLMLYFCLTTLLYPLGRLWILRRMVQGKEDSACLRERFGHASHTRPKGPLMWIHGASVGEAMGTLGLIDTLLQQNTRLSVLLTTGTQTSARLLRQRFAGQSRIIHQMLPFDWFWCVKRFLRFWRPDCFLLMEGDLWPHLLSLSARQKIPIFFMNAQISERSFARWRGIRPFFRLCCHAMRECLAVSESHAERLVFLGAPCVRVVGSLKWTAPPIPADASTLHAYEQRWKGRRIWLAASTHEGEEKFILDAYRLLLRDYPDLQLILAPRYIIRVPEIEKLLEAEKMESSSIYLVTEMGVLGTFYRLADVVFVGGSLSPRVGGHNIIEPALCGAAVLYGPCMMKQQDVVTLFENHHISSSVSTVAACAAEVSALLKNEDERGRRIRRALHLIEEQKERILKIYLEALSSVMSGKS